MPTITIPRKQFERYVGKKLETDRLRDRISYLGTDIECITEDEFTVEVFPNRPDMLSVPGLARAFSSFIGEKIGLRRYEVRDSGEKVIIDKSVGKVRPYTACAIVKDLKYDDEKIKEVIQIQEKLHVTFGRNRRKLAIGIYPFEKIRPPIRFLAKKPEDIKFRPLEYNKTINGRQMLSMHPAGREYGHLLEGLDLFPVFEDAEGSILSMPPIINSHETGKIGPLTKDVFIECSGFDLRVLERCINIIVTAMADMGGRVFSMELHYPDKKIVSPRLEPVKMKIEVAYISRLLGLDLSPKDIGKLLERMGYGYKAGSVLIPPYRTDILHQVDLVEDVAIAHGFENFKPTIPNVATIGEEDPLEVRKRAIANVLSGLGYLEVNTYNLTSREVQCRMMGHEEELVELANALSQEYNVLRKWMLPSALEILKANRQHEYPQQIFGTGTLFSKDASAETGVLERDSLMIATSGDKSNFTEIRQAADYLFSQLGLSVSYKQASHPSFIDGRVAGIFLGNKKLGLLGEVAPSVLENFKLEMPVAACEINLSIL
jgi:phenylalanyl-tRNA synthetase beta chain